MERQAEKDKTERVTGLGTRTTIRSKQSETFAHFLRRSKANYLRCLGSPLSLEWIRVWFCMLRLLPGVLPF